MVLLLLYELTLGKNSYWYPYLRLMPTVRFSCFWTQEEIDAIQSPKVVQALKEYRVEVVNEWYMFKKVIRKYPWIFQERYINKDLFYNLYGQVCTRCFGYGLPSTTMVPMADNVNHSSFSITNEIVNIKKHMEEDKEDLDYLRTDKLICNFSGLFKHQKVEAPSHVVNGRFNKEVYLKNHKLISVESTKDHMSKDYMQIWHIPYLYMNLTESNDTSDEEDGEQEKTVEKGAKMGQE